MLPNQFDPLVVFSQRSSYSNQLMCRGVVLPEITMDEKDNIPESFFTAGLIPPSWCRFAPEPDFACPPAVDEDGQMVSPKPSW